jgi:hypothetical protein
MNAMLLAIATPRSGSIVFIWKVQKTRSDARYPIPSVQLIGIMEASGGLGASVA